MTLLALLACNDGTDTSQDSEVVVLEDTGPFWSDLVVEPDGLSVHPGAVLQVRVTALGPDGRVDVDAELSVSGPATLEGDILTVSESGEVVLTATAYTLQATGTLAVRGDGLLKVTVLDESGEPVFDARVMVDGVRTETNAEGLAELAVDDKPVTITVFGEDESLVPATFIGVQARDVTLPLRTSEGRSPDSEVSGSIDFSASLPPEEGQLGIAIAGRTLVQHPLLLNADDLLSEKREVEVIGLQLDVPGNIAVQDYDETYAVPAWTGVGGAWVLAGPLNVVDLLGATSDVGAAVELLAAHPEDFKYARVGTVAPDSALNLKPTEPLDTLVRVTLPELPETAGVPLLVALEPTSEGLAPSGLGTGDIQAAGDPSQVLAYVEDGGVGSGGARVLQVAPLVDGSATIAPFQSFPVITSFDGATRAFDVSTDADAVYVRVWIEAEDGSLRDLYFRAGETSGVIPDEGPAMGYGKTQWDLLVLERELGTWESVLGSGDLTDPEEALRSTAALDEERIGG
jgi:hypothetical protein